MLWIANTTTQLFYLVMVGVEAADQLAPVGLLLLLELGPAGGGQQQSQEGRGSPAAPHHWCGRVGGALAPAGLVRQDTTPAPHALLHYKPPCHSPGRLYSPPPLCQRRAINFSAGSRTRHY